MTVVLRLLIFNFKTFNLKNAIQYPTEKNAAPRIRSQHTEHGRLCVDHSGHLAIMSGFELDIDYPYEIIREDNLVTKPEPIPYSTTRMRYRHYGHTLEVLIRKACEFPEGNEKRNLVAMICNHMKKDYMAWNKDTVDDRKIAEDLYELSDGKLQLTDDIIRLMAERLNQNYRPKVNYNNNRNSNPRRRY